MPNEQLQEAYEKERSVVKAECQQDKPPESVFRASRHHLQRLDEASRAVSEYAKAEIDCRKGCYYCCYFKKEVGAEEVFLIVDHIKRHFNQAQIDQVTQAALDARNKIQQMSQSRRIQSNLACALLIDGQCSVYEARPAICRKLHSQNVSSCEASYNNPEDSTIENDEHPLISSVLTTMNAAARQGIDDAGLDAALYDLNQVLWGALSETKYLKRWKKGKTAFVSG